MAPRSQGKVAEIPKEPIRPLPVGGAFLNLYTFRGLVLVVLVVLIVVKIP